MKELKYYKSEKQNNRDRLLTSITIIVFLYFINSLFKEKLYFTLIIFGVLFFFVLYQFINSFLNKPKVICNEKGIYSKTNNMGLIEWKNINKVSIKQSYNRFNFLVAEIDDVKNALKSKNLFTRILMKSNTKKLGSPVVYPKMLFHKPLEEVVIEINEFMLKIKNDA